MTVVLTFRKRTTPKRYPAAKLMAGSAQGEVILFPGIQRVHHADGMPHSTGLKPGRGERSHKEH